MSLTRRRLARLVVGAVVGGGVASLLAACSAAPTQPSPTPVNPLIKPKAEGSGMVALQASSELAVGRNRFAVGLVDGRNQPLTSGALQLEFFKLKKDGTAEKRGESPATFRSVGSPSKGLWVAPAEFNEMGQWGAQATLTPSGQAPISTRLNFEVLEKFSAPGYGDPAVRSASLTTADVGGDVSHVCTNQPPCELHTQSIAGALEGGQKPLVVVFATPALCTSATCGPELDAVLQLQKTYGDRANFIHVEIYEYPFDGQRVAKAVEEWKLPSDPWTFVADRGGTVRDRFEGSAPAEEIEPALKAVLS